MVRKSGVHDVTVFGAKVTNIEKINEQSKWQVSWSELEDDGAGKVKELKKEDVSRTLKICRCSAADQISFLMQLWSHLDIIMLHVSRIHRDSQTLNAYGHREFFIQRAIEALIAILAR